MRASNIVKKALYCYSSIIPSIIEVYDIEVHQILMRCLFPPRVGVHWNVCSQGSPIEEDLSGKTSWSCSTLQGGAKQHPHREC